ncbi:MAG: phosphonate C-P lyase system protein PhnG [Rhodospirillaceae bacterium]|nr:phosphonate C-P lyase system protein PhnG [Rhodospirillaceae bacterium]
MPETSHQDQPADGVPKDRAEWMGLLARAPERDLEAAWQALAPNLPEAGTGEYEFLRAPEQGLVMVQGRAGGDGNAFNLGEMTVTRCAVRLADGTVGHGYVAGRSARHAELAAVFDGLLQTDRWAALVTDRVILPVKTALGMAKAAKAAKTAATKVEFFTMVREQGAGPE